MSSTTELHLEENGNAEDKYGMTHVCRAIKSGNKDLVLAYIKQGVDMNYRNSVDGVTAFIRGCNTENVDMVNFLIDHVDNLDVNLTDRHGHTALFYSCQYGYKEIIRLLLKRTKAIVTSDVIEKGLPSLDDSTLKELIDAYRNQRNSAGELFCVIAKGPASLALLQYAKSDSNIEYGDALDDAFLSACKSNSNVDTVTWFLIEGGRYKNNINTCVDSDGRTGLLLAVLNHADSIVKLLLENGASPNVRDNAGWDAIECANRSYDDGADYLRLRDPPEVVFQIIHLLNEHNNNHQN